MGSEALLPTTVDTLRAIEGKRRNRVLHSDSRGSDFATTDESGLNSEVEGDWSSEDHDNMHCHEYRRSVRSGSEAMLSTHAMGDEFSAPHIEVRKEFSIHGCNWWQDVWMVSSAESEEGVAMGGGRRSLLLRNGGIQGSDRRSVDVEAPGLADTSTALQPLRHPIDMHASDSNRRGAGSRGLVGIALHATDDTALGAQVHGFRRRHLISQPGPLEATLQ